MSEIKRVELRPEPIEILLNPISSNWEQAPLYTWQWDSERNEYNPREIYNLDNFSKRMGEGIIIFTKGDQFLVETQGSYKHVLTNMEPKTKDKWFYNSRDSPVSKTLSELL